MPAYKAIAVHFARSIDADMPHSGNIQCNSKIRFFPLLSFRHVVEIYPSNIKTTCSSLSAINHPTDSNSSLPYRYLQHDDHITSRSRIAREILAKGEPQAREMAGLGNRTLAVGGRPRLQRDVQHRTVPGQASRQLEAPPDQREALSRQSIPSSEARVYWLS